MTPDAKPFKEIVEEAIADGKLTKAEHQRILAAASADGKIDEDELELMQKLLQMIDRGELQVVD